MKKILGMLGALVLSLTTVTSAMAVPLVVDGGWLNFNFGDVGEPWEKFGETAKFQFTLINPGKLTVTDAFLSGDQLSVTNFGSDLGPTSVPTSIGDSIGTDFTAAAADPKWSTGMFFLDIGTYEISGSTLVTPFGDGGAAIRVDTVTAPAPIPEPGTMLLLGSGLLGLSFWRWSTNVSFLI
jgi:hypothetical protein